MKYFNLAILVLWSISLSYGQGHPKLEKIPEAEMDLMKLEKV